MRSLHRSEILFATVIAALAMMFVCPAMAQEREVRPADELDYPVLLVHGLGEGPGEEAFGNLEELLETYYFDVEVMDFNSYANNDLADHRDAGNLGTLAAILGMRIRSILDDYNTERLHIVTHSYGGLIVQAYLLNFGEEYAPKKGGYGDNVAKVVYIQVPFYGVVTDDEDTLQAIAEDTDYGPYTDWREMMRTLELGSQWIYDMDIALRGENIYREDIDAVTFVSSDDEYVSPLFGTLNAFMEKSVTHPFHRFRIFQGAEWGNYSHTHHPLSETNRLSSLAYVESTADPIFFSIASFLDNGRMWRKIGKIGLSTEVIALVHYDKAKGYKNIGEGDITLTLKRKTKVSGARRSPGARAARRGDVFNGFYNSRSRTFVFTDLPPGQYDININNPKGEGFEAELEFDPTDLMSYSYNPKKNELRVGSTPVSDLEGLLVVPEIVIQYPLQTAATYQISGLNTNGFFIEFDIESAAWDSAGSDGFNKGVVLGLYNGNATLARSNGSRFEIWLRGSRVQNNDTLHAGEINLLVCHDKNKNGVKEPAEGEELKPDTKFNWRNSHHVRVVVQNINDQGWSDTTLYVDGRNMGACTRSTPYYNPNPTLAIGGVSFEDDWKYRAPVGAKITNLVVDNLN